MAKGGAYDAVVVGGGPNGLAAAITLQEKFGSVLLVEGKDTIGGGTRSAELTLPGFVHDICAAVHPLGIASPFFRSIDLSRHGLRWIQPDLPLAHPFEDGSALFLDRSLENTGTVLGADGGAYRELVAPFVDGQEDLLADILAPPRFPRHPRLTGRFALKAWRSCRHLAEKTFQDAKTRALFAGLSAHAMVPLDSPATAAFGIVLAVLAHAVGWPFVEGGSQRLADALASRFQERGGKIVTGRPVAGLDDLPAAQAYFFDVTPRQLLNMAGTSFPAAYRRRLGHFRYGPGVCKADWALREPIPWKAEACRRAGTVHLGETLEEIDGAIRHAHGGGMSPTPYVILTQPSLFDPSRAPRGRHTAWAYCHAPHGSREDAADLMESRIERYAPGFRDIILERSTLTPADMERYNPNYIGGDINGGLQDLFQILARPVPSFHPYRTGAKNILMCSSSTPPGGGVHGLCGFYAARCLLGKSG